MEILVIVIMAIVSIALAAVVLFLLWRPASKQGDSDNIRDILSNQQVAEMKAELGKVSDLVRQLEKDRENKFGQLTAQLKTMAEQNTALNTTTGALREALANTRVRGQWGERMAEDVLRLIGFVERVNYVKQTPGDGSRSRPDFTFLLPRDFKLNMDVKFPLDNYLRCVEANTSQDEEQYRQAFLRDVRDRLKEVVTRDYIDPAQNTLDCVLVFIPNEKTYHFIQEQSGSLIDDALKNKIVLCSPLTLYAILVVIRQAVDNFTIELASNEIISELGAFRKQWALFVSKMQSVGKKIVAVQQEYESLTTTRQRALERPLNRIEAIRKQRGLGLPTDVEDGGDQIALDVLEYEASYSDNDDTEDSLPSRN